jgi:hypothetical protein
MSEEQIALARRAVACKGWRWMPGMRVEWVGMGTGWRMLSKTQSWYEREECEDGEPGGPNAIPDLTDPATMGCLLALVREARQSPRTHVLYVEGLERWECADREQVHSCGMTEAEALVVALEEAQ